MFASLVLAAVVYPSAAAVPQNLLRMSFVFPTPQMPDVIDAVTLRTDDGRQLRRPFLDQELWSPDGRTLTVLFHPGRVKSGVLTHDQLGFPLPAGTGVTVLLRGSPIKRWRITPPDYRQPAPARWRIAAPRAGTREALAITFERPIEMLDAGMIGVAFDAKRVEGRVTLGAGESSWTFTPVRPWRSGPYRIVVATALEDPQGNAVGEAFQETRSQFSRVLRPFVVLPLFIRSSAARRTPA